jgi:membrane protein DedA with SNARE-associated domain
MPLADLHGAAYAAIAIAAAVEGEVVFVAAAALVSQGRLDPLGVILAGAIGASLGDQFYFYVIRGGLRWLRRSHATESRAARLAQRVRQHEALTIVAIRFSPGLRIALSAACAYAGVAPLKFSALNMLSSLVWATALLFVVAWFGPSFLARLGLSGWWVVLIPALLVIVIFRWLGRHESRAVDGATLARR